MEEKQEFKGNLGFIWLIGILVILLGCVTVYTLKLTKENNELKQVSRTVQQPIQTPVITQETKKEETMKTEKDKNEIIDSIDVTNDFDKKKLNQFTYNGLRLNKFNKLSEANFIEILNYINAEKRLLKLDSKGKIISSFNDVKKLISDKFIIDNSEKVNEEIKSVIKKFNESDIDFYFDENGDATSISNNYSKVLSVRKENENYIIETINYNINFLSSYIKNGTKLKLSKVIVNEIDSNYYIKINFYEKYYNKIKNLSREDQIKKLESLIEEYAIENDLGHRKYTVTGTSIDNFKIISIK